jgi:hypothetical protein
MFIILRHRIVDRLIVYCDSIPFVPLTGLGLSLGRVRDASHPYASTLPQHARRSIYSSNDDFVNDIQGQSNDYA